MSVLLFISFILTNPSVVISSCPSECVCPQEVPRCAAGVSVVLDGCGCCKICSRQLNEDCSKVESCDHTKGLECNFGASFDETRGICRAKSEGRPCEYNSKIYQNGESFQPNCKHQCTCIDGAVGCIPLCPQELSLPNMGCPNPRLVKVAGQCCEEWVCDERISVDSGNKGVMTESWSDESENELTDRNEFVTMVKSLPAFQIDPVNFDRPECIIQTTAWSQCTKTCGNGISTRITNNNNECKMVKETRLCVIRPCNQSSNSSKKGKKCSRTKRFSQAVKFTYSGCTSLKKYWSRYCGSCADGRCCSPHQTRTIWAKFSCEDGEVFHKNIMMIKSCKCSFNCPPSNEASYPFYRLINDIHKFKD